MGIKCGIVGLPNVGKSSLFNILSEGKAEAANYPFCTIEPNVGVVMVPDPRLDQLSAINSPEETIPSIVEFVDIAGLVEGASQGEGLGNKFLANIRETDAIIHVVRCFEDKNVTHVSDEINPVNDFEIINTELLLADIQTVERNLERAGKQSKAGDKAMLARHAFLEALLEHLNHDQPARTYTVGKDQESIMKELSLLTKKPMLCLANIDEASIVEESEGLQALREKVKSVEDAELLKLCVSLELEISTLEPSEMKEFLDELNLEEPAINKLIRASYDLLNLQTFFTAGPKEVRAWPVRKQSLAPQAAGTIHTDFERGFIKAEVIGYEDYIENNGEQGAKSAGKLRLEGKDYMVQEGDVMHFKFNV